LSGTNSDGTLGGALRFRSGEYNQSYVWWKPIEQVRIFLGKDGDGQFETADVVSWGFYAGPDNTFFHNWGFWRTIFPGNWDSYGLALSFYPTEGLDINVVFPAGDLPISDPDSAHKNAGMLPGHISLIANYNIGDVGKISLVYQGGGAAGFDFPTVGQDDPASKKVDEGKAALTSETGLIGASFLLTSIEGLQVKVGGSILPNAQIKVWDGITTDATVTDTNPGYITMPDKNSVIFGGLGVAWTGDGFGVKFRLGTVMYQATGVKPIIVTDIYPWIKVGDNGTASINIGVTQDGNEYVDLNGKKIAKLGWSVTPAYRLNLDGGSFKIGLRVYNNLGENQFISGADYVKWAIPMCLSFGF